jgi:hypothetical protein
MRGHRAFGRESRGVSPRSTFMVEADRRRLRGNLGPGVEEGGQRDEVPLKCTFVLRDAGRQRLEASHVRPSAERYASQIDLHSGRKSVRV